MLMILSLQDFSVSVIMPPIRRSNIGARNKNTRRVAILRENANQESQEEIADHMEADRVGVIMPPIRQSNIGARNKNTRRVANLRANQMDEQHAHRNEQVRLRMTNMRDAFSQEDIANHMEADRVARATRRTNDDLDERNFNRRKERRTRAPPYNLNRAAFRYDSTLTYNDLPCVNIGPLNVVCQHCNALKFSAETPGLCCAGGKVKLPVLAPPPQPLRSLLYEDTTQSRHFLAHIQQYNGCFQMTSFGATVIQERGYNPTFKVMSSEELSHYVQCG